jgi:hypothetical protein
MPLFRTAAAAVAFAALASPPGAGLAAEPRSDAAPGSRDVVQVGPVLGDAEKDSFGLPRGPDDDCGRVPFSSRDPALHGPSTGDPEKDSFGLRVVGQYDSCDGTIR